MHVNLFLPILNSSSHLVLHFYMMLTLTLNRNPV